MASTGQVPKATTAEAEVAVPRWSATWELPGDRYIGKKSDGIDFLNCYRVGETKEHAVAGLPPRLGSRRICAGSGSPASTQAVETSASVRTGGGGGAAGNSTKLPSGAGRIGVKTLAYVGLQGVIVCLCSGPQLKSVR